MIHGYQKLLASALFQAGISGGRRPFAFIATELGSPAHMFPVSRSTDTPSCLSNGVYSGGCSDI
jgi:hypothetical protein